MGNTMMKIVLITDGRCTYRINWSPTDTKNKKNVTSLTTTRRTTGYYHFIKLFLSREIFKILNYDIFDTYYNDSSLQIRHWGEFWSIECATQSFSLQHSLWSERLPQNPKYWFYLFPFLKLKPISVSGFSISLLFGSITIIYNQFLIKRNINIFNCIYP